MKILFTSKIKYYITYNTSKIYKVKYTIDYDHTLYKKLKHKLYDHKWFMDSFELCSLIKSNTCSLSIKSFKFKIININYNIRTCKRQFILDKFSHNLKCIIKSYSLFDINIVYDIEKLISLIDYKSQLLYVTILNRIPPINDNLNKLKQLLHYHVNEESNYNIVLHELSKSNNYDHNILKIINSIPITHSIEYILNHYRRSILTFYRMMEPIEKCNQDSEIEIMIRELNSYNDSSLYDIVITSF